MKVKDAYPNIDVYKLEQLSLNSEYYLKVLNFIEQVWDRELIFLTKGQVFWLSKINDDLEEKELKGII